MLRERARASREEIESLLRGRGLRRTHARVTVLGHLLAHPEPATHARIAEALAGDGLDRVTVYRNLIDLADAGLLLRTDLGDHVWRFELKGKGDGAHPHFLCTGCGGVTCLPVGAVKLVASRRAPKAIGRRQVVVQVSGVCDACAAG